MWESLYYPGKYLVNFEIISKYKVKKKWVVQLDPMVHVENRINKYTVLAVANYIDL